MAGPVSNIRSWLRRAPVPHTLRADGQEISLREGRNKWKDAEETVIAMGAQALEALDAHGKIIRVCKLDLSAQEEDDVEDEKALGSSLDAITGKGAGGDLVIVARLILEASDRGAQRHAEAYALAFDKMATLVEFSVQRLNAVEIAWQNALKAMGENAGVDQESAATAGIMSMLGQVAAANAQAPRPPPRRPNGKGGEHHGD